MNLPNSVRVGYEDLRELDWTAVTANFVGVGAAVSNPIRMIKFANNTDALLLMSFDGLTAVDVFPKNTFFILDYGSNRADQGGYLELPAGSRFYVKAEAALPTYGKFYITVMYASQV